MSKSNFYRRGVDRVRNMFGVSRGAAEDIASGTGIMPYDPIYAAQQAMKSGVPIGGAGAHDVLPPGRWAEFMQRTAPARAGLAVGVPAGLAVGGLVGAGVYNDPNMKYSPEAAKSVAAGAMGIGTGLATGLRVGAPTYANRKNMQAQLRKIRESLHDIHASGQAPVSAVPGAIEDMLRQSPGMPVRGGARTYFGQDDVFEGTLGDVADSLRKTEDKIDFLGLDALFAQRRADRSGKARAAENAKDQIFKAMSQGIAGDTPAMSPGAQLLEKLQQREPALTTKELMRRLHPDRVSRNPDINTEIAGEAFNHLSQGIPPTQDYMAPARAAGLAAHARRAEVLRDIDRGMSSMFPNGRKINAGLDEVR